MSVERTWSTILSTAALMATAWVASAGCAPQEPTVSVEPDPARPLETYGALGPWGVGEFERTFVVRVDDRVDARVFVPLDEAREPAREAFAPVLLVHGGLVEPARYDWLARHLASRGYVVLAPGHRLELALFEVGNALDALDAARRAARQSGDVLHEVLSPGAPAAVMGHSLGGVVAGKSWLRAPGDVELLVMLASFPAAGDDFAARRAMPGARIVSISGGADGSALPEEVEAGAEQMRQGPVPVDLFLVDGMNHYQWTTGYTEDELDGDGQATLSDEEARAAATFVIDAALATWQRPERAGDILSQPMLWPAPVLTWEGFVARRQQ